MKKIYTIGRDEGCDIVIPDNTDVISRLHATVRVESNDKIFLIDQSRNGTYVNGMKMSSNVEIPVSREDVVSFAHIYNLDWSLVPKPKSSTLKIILIFLAALLVLAGISYAVIASFDNAESENDVQENTESQLVPNNEDEVFKPDTVIVRDTVVVAKDRPKIKKAKETEKDTVKVEEPQEEVYNPIY